MSEKKKVAGVVDRVEGDTAVVVFKDPDSGDNREVYVDKKKMKKVSLKEGDEVTVEMSRQTATVLPAATGVNLHFTGEKSEEMAKRFFSYLVDGGLEDQLIQTLSGKGMTLEISDCDPDRLSVTFSCTTTPDKSSPAVARKK